MYDNLKPFIAQRRKKTIIFLSLTALANLLIPIFYPFLVWLASVCPQLKLTSAHFLITLLIWSIYTISEVLGDDKSELKCPYCGALQWFVEKTEEEGAKNRPQGYIRRHYKCKKCGEREKIYVAPLSLNISNEDMN